MGVGKNVHYIRSVSKLAETTSSRRFKCHLGSGTMHTPSRTSCHGQDEQLEGGKNLENKFGVMAGRYLAVAATVHDTDCTCVWCQSRKSLQCCSSTNTSIQRSLCHDFCSPSHDHEMCMHHKEVPWPLCNQHLQHLQVTLQAAEPKSACKPFHISHAVQGEGVQCIPLQKILLHLRHT